MLGRLTLCLLLLCASGFAGEVPGTDVVFYDQSLKRALTDVEIKTVALEGMPYGDSAARERSRDLEIASKKLSTNIRRVQVYYGNHPLESMKAVTADVYSRAMAALRYHDRADIADRLLKHVERLQINFWNDEVAQVQATR